MPTIIGLLSKQSSESEQGQIMGSVSSVISLSSLTGPIIANAIFGLSMQANYLVASGLGLLGVVLLVRLTLSFPF